MLIKKYGIFLLLLVLGLPACQDDDEPIIPNEEELITTVRYILTPDGGGAQVVFTFQDLDGDGGNAPIYTTDILEANTTYNGTVEILNEAESPAENVTEEIEAEQEDHQFFYVSSIGDLTVAYNDQDANGNPIGLSTILTTGNAGTGSLDIILLHEPNKSGSGVAQGNPENAGGESDIEVTFEVNVE